MITRVRDDAKIVEVWLTKSENNDACIRESLKTLYQEYKEKKYMVAVFVSGNGDLVEGTKELLLHNKKVAALNQAAV